MKKAKPKQTKWRKHLVWIVLGIAVLGSLTIAAYIGLVAYGVRLDKDKLTMREAAVRVLDANGENINHAANYVPLDEMPADLVNAFVAVEDKRFFQHKGLDLRRIGGALVQNIKKGAAVQGASTITCQLIKNTHLNNEKTVERKIKEAKLALEIEREYSKQEILEMYLNIIYFGSGLNGVGSAAQGFFGKAPMDLNTAECASIAATTVNPARYSPRLNDDNNPKRKDVVLGLMYEQGYLDQEEYTIACDTAVDLAPESDDIYKTYCINCIDEAERVTGLSHAQLANGYTIHTYCTADDQSQVTKHLPSTGDALAALCTTDGHIVAMATTYTLRQSGVRRQMGSTIKPFVYACAIEQDKLLPDSILVDEPTSFGQYSPANYHDIYYGRLSARDALAKSSNVAACKVLGYCGAEANYDFALRCGLPLSPEDKHTALALGGLTHGVTADEVLTAYTALAQGGVRHDAHMVRCIVDKNGHTVYRDTPSGARVMRESTAYLTSRMLQATTRVGTALRLGDCAGDVAAKTGTVAGKSDNCDAWCVAYNSAYIALCWCGNLSMQPQCDIEATGGGTPTLAVHHILDGHTGYTFDRPNEVIQQEIDTYTLQTKSVLCRASANTPLRYRQWIECTRLPLPRSTTFEQAPTVQASIDATDKGVRVRLQAQSACTYLVQVDYGFGSVVVDTIEGDGPIERLYDRSSGVWQVVAVLHGQTDLYSTPYSAVVL